MKRVCAAFCIGILSASASVAAASQSEIKLAPHRAIYEISLGRTSPGGMVAARGRTVIEFRDACIGWTTTQRFVSDMTNAQGDPARTDFIATSSESKDGRAMRFTVKNTVDGRTSQRFEGIATLAPSGRGTVELSVPHGKNFPLPVGVILPTQHTLEILRAAASGTDSLHELVFQGGDKHDLYDATALIGHAVPRSEMDADRKVDEDNILDGASARHVLISYFPHASRVSAADYEVAYHLYSNGVVSAMQLIYPNFTLSATLVRLEKLEPDCRER